MFNKLSRSNSTQIFLLVSFTALLCRTSLSLAWSPSNGWRDSYAVDGQCYCDSSNFDHQLDTKSARTPLGEKNIVTICSDIEAALGEGPASGRIPFNDIQCGNGPANNAVDETGCPGRVDMGNSGCDIIGPRWNLEDVYGPWPENCSESRRLQQNTWYMFSMPCDVQLPGKGSVAEVLADDLGADRIGVDWTIFSLLENGSYKELALSDQLLSGVGYWLITNQRGKTIDVAGEYPIEVDVTLHAGSELGAWSMVGSPFRYSVTWADAGVVNSRTGTVVPLSTDNSSDDACTSIPVSSRCTVYNLAYKWTESGSYETMNISTGNLNAFEGAWVRAATDGMRIRLPMPYSEQQAR